MKNRTLLSVVVLIALAVVALVFLHRRQGAGQTRQADTGNVVTQGVPDIASHGEAASHSSEAAGIPAVDWEDHLHWKGSPEYKALSDELEGIEKSAEARGSLTTNEARVIIGYLQSPHFDARNMALIAAVVGKEDPARSMLMPYVVNLLTDRVSLVRMWAARTLGMIGQKSDIHYLEPLLNDKSEHVVNHVRIAISKLQGAQ